MVEKVERKAKQVEKSNSFGKVFVGGVVTGGLFMVKVYLSAWMDGYKMGLASGDGDLKANMHGANHQALLAVVEDEIKKRRKK